jgi:hypothetical protein
VLNRPWTRVCHVVPDVSARGWPLASGCGCSNRPWTRVCDSWPLALGCGVFKPAVDAGLRQLAAGVGVWGVQTGRGRGFATACTMCVGSRLAAGVGVWVFKPAVDAGLRQLAAGVGVWGAETGRGRGFATSCPMCRSWLAAGVGVWVFKPAVDAGLRRRARCVGSQLAAGLGVWGVQTGPWTRVCTRND